MFDFEKLKEISLRTIDIKGKDYVMVNERVKAFRMLCPEGTILTELISDVNGVCTIKASIYDGDRLLATGYAQEKETSSYINKTSYVENCESSAIGRALGFCGIGIDSDIASAEEAETAINNQERIKAEEKQIGATKAKALRAMFETEGIIEDFILEVCGISKLEELTEGRHRWITNNIKSVKEKQNRWSVRAK